MKKFTKFLGIFLALSMVIGMLSVVGAVETETPTAPAAPTGAIKQGTVLEVVSPTKIETVFGYYEDGTGEDVDSFVDCEDGACVTDGWFARAGYSECTSDDGLIAAVMTLNETTTLGGIEIVCKTLDNAPAEFYVEALVDGGWEEVLYGNNSFSTGLTQMFTFDAVETNTVRILVPAVETDGEQCYFNEVTLFTPVTGNLKTVIDMNGKATASDAHASSNANYAIDGDKSTFFTGSTVTVGLGEATAIDGFNLYHYRNSSFPNNITVKIQQTEGGEMVEIGTFATGFTTAGVQDSCYVTFDQTYMAYAVQFVSDVWGYQNDYELWQYQRESATEEPTEPEVTEPEATEPAAPTYELTTGAPTTGVAYKWAANTGDAEGILTFVGTTANKNYYLSTSTTMTEGVDVYVEEVTGGYQMYFTDGETKTYIDIYKNGNYVNARLTDAPTAVFTWNSDYNTFVTDIEGTPYYLGTYTNQNSGVTYTTLSASKLSFMTPENVDVSQYPARFYAEVSTVDPEPTEPEVTEPEVTEPEVTEPAVEPEKQLIDLTGTVVGACSTNSATASSYADFTWWSDGRPDWKPLGNFVDGNLSTYFSFGAGTGERADLYLDLSNTETGYTAIDEFTIYHSSQGDVPSVMVVLVLEDGTEWTKTYETNWVLFGGNTSVTEVLDETKNAVGMYIWQNGSDSAHFGDIEIYEYVTGTTEPEPTEPEATEPEATEPEATEPEATEPEVTEPEPTEEPTQPVNADGIVSEIVLSNMGTLNSMGVTPEFGYYDNTEMTGSVIDYQAAAGEDACLVDGNTSNSGWSGKYAYTDLVDNGGTKVPVILADLGEATAVGGIELISVDSNCSAPTHFAVQVTTAADSDVWETVLEAENVTWNGKETRQFAFDSIVDAYKIRLVVYNLSAQGDSTETQFALHEVTLMSAQMVPMVDEAPLTDSNVLQYGYYADLELTDYRDSVLGNNVPANLFDGDASSLAITNTEDWTWGAGAGMAGNGGYNTAVLTLDVTQNGEPTAINYMQMTVQGQYYYAPTSYALQVTTSAEEDNWTTIYEVDEFSWEDHGSNSYYVTFDEVSAYKVRLLVTETHVDQNNLCYFGMGDFVLGTVEIVNPDEPIGPTDPEATEPEATEPAEALPEAPVVVPGTTTITGGAVKEGDIYVKIPNSMLSAQFGYYNASGAFVDGNDGSCTIDGWYGRSGYSECTTADGQMALILTSDEVKNIGSMVIIPRGGYPENAPVDFEIQAMVDGEWVTVVDVDENPFTNGHTVGYTFPAVATNQIRLLINAVSNPANQCYLDEVELYEVTTGKLYNDIDLVGKVTASNAFGNNPASNLTDGDKATNTTGSNYTINLTGADGQPTSIDGFRMYFHRGNSSIITVANILIQTTPGGEFVSIGEFTTGWNSSDPREIVVAEFDQTYDAYALQLNFDTNAPSHEFELFQYQKDAAPIDPDQPDPTDPETQPSEPETQPSEPETQPSEPETQPSEPETQPSEPETQPSEPETQPSEPETQPSEPETQPSEPETQPSEPELPDVPELPGLTVDVTAIQATIDLIHALNPNDYTAESYEALVVSVKAVNEIIAAGNYTQKLIDDANAKLLNALEALVPVDGGTGTPGGDSDLPADTGDVMLTVLSAMMTMSAIGGAVVVGKKKFF